MRRTRLLWSALLIGALIVTILPFTAPGAAQHIDDLPPVVTPDNMLTLHEEDLGPATRDIVVDFDAAIRPALDAYLQRFGDLPGIATADAPFVSAIPTPIPPVYLPLIVGPPPRIMLPPEPTPAPPPPGADVTAVIWPEPSIRVGRGMTLTYEIRVYNDGTGDARSTTVVVPYNRNHILPIASRFDRGAGDWVSELTPTQLTVTFGRLGGSKMRSGFIDFRVNTSLATNTVIETRSTFRWSDEDRGGSGRSNWAPVLVGGGNDTTPFVWLIVEPVRGATSATRTFFSDRFVPGENVVTWLNTPRGVRPLDVAATADPSGRVWLTYRPSDLTQGTYQIVAHGTRSRLTGVASFVVQ
ncbi:MAG: hypothetical protein NZ699_08815 [Roseiflexus sp.]|nr:hypothetical protein [Roseiflexus sp.]MCS7289218.1 hypothetical protein [Roseiflexus sp.]MDW8146721.1 hypothetical protein [Roseiflexaceae bacterium]MDW8232632.1 hypothetical protein [Roseiflexaceae bacterium]